MYIFKNNKISLNIPEVHGVPGTRFSITRQCNYVNVLHFISIHVKKVCIM